MHRIPVQLLPVQRPADAFFLTLIHVHFCFQSPLKPLITHQVPQVKVEWRLKLKHEAQLEMCRLLIAPYSHDHLD